MLPSFSIDGDLLNVTSNFAAGFTSDSNFDQVTTAVLNDSGAPVPYGMEIVQNSYSNTGEEFMIIRYGFVNNSGAAVSNLYAGITIDWDIADYLTNLGGYSLPENMVYQYDNAGYYYGMSVLDKNEFSGARVTLDSPAPDARTGSFQYITTLDVNSVTDPGDYRTWIGAGPYSVNAGDTVWATFGIVAGDDLQVLKDNAYAASQKALSVGFTDVSVGIGDDNQLPTVFSLEQNYPNPFNPSTTLKYALPTNADVRLEIYNVLGQLVKVLVDADQTAGFKTAIWDGTNQYGEKVASGIYIYRIKAADFVQSKKMILMK
ncbi:MAG: T9SS type A sorting domain-containing protein [Calditrichia bacterium]